MNKKIADLNTTIWYRLLKVVYIFSFLFAVAFTWMFIYITNPPSKVMVVDNEKTYIVCNRIQKTFPASKHGFYFNDGDHEYNLSDEIKSRIADLCGFDAEEIVDTLEAYATDGVKTLPPSFIPGYIDPFSLNIAYKTFVTFGWRGVIFYWTIALILLLTIFEVIKRAFYYVALGGINPK